MPAGGVLRGKCAHAAAGFNNVDVEAADKVGAQASEGRARGIWVGGGENLTKAGKHRTDILRSSLVNSLQAKMRTALT